MIVVFDNDVVQKLATLGLLTEAVAAIGAAECHVLSTCRFKLQINNPEKGRKKLGDEVFDRIKSFLDDTKRIENDNLVGLDVAANAALGVDPGELQLFAFTAKTAGALLVTGDKRALFGAMSAPDCAPLIAAVAGRVVCFEQVLDLLLETTGFVTVHAKAAAVPEVDKVVRAVFSAVATEQDVREGLASYIRDIRGKTGALLRPPAVP